MTLHKYPESSQVNGRTNLRKRKGRKGNEGAEMGRFASLAFGWTSLLLCQSKSHTSCGLKGVLTSVFNGIKDKFFSRLIEKNFD